ncbi:protein NLRC3-like isoform 2-T2 [Polymixia lowei]
MKSDDSMWIPPDFSNEPKPSRGSSSGSVTVDPDRCAECEEVLRDPVRITCVHWFCRQCVTSHWDQTGPSRDHPCPNCGKKPRTGLQLQPQMDDDLQEALAKHKTTLKARSECVLEGTMEAGTRTPLNRVYTELYITEGQSEGVNTQHEVWQLETVSKIQTLQDTPIKCNDIFKAFPGDERHIRAVVTLGVAGIGKTFSVQKFTLDWAEGTSNQDVSLMILLSFRELNLIKDEQYSLLGLIHVFLPTLKSITAEQLTVCKVVFIFDGLDESRFPLDFLHNEVVSDVTQTSSVDVLLTNLIKGELLPSAHLWITTRPAAANQIPHKCVARVTEVRGFTDPQKEEYFRKRFRDETLASRIISHIKTSRTFHIMCHIPVFCWITATVLEHVLNVEERREMPKTQTEMYAHFLIVQTKRKKQKFDRRHEVDQQELMETDKEVLLKLGRLAFEHLEKGNLMFYQEDLEKCGLDVTDAALYSGVCTEIFKRECVLFQRTVYCFVHLSIQEFLAAVYIFNCYTNRNVEVLTRFLVHESEEKYHDDTTLEDFLKRTTNKALNSKNGHLDLFVRFLHGLLLESSQCLLAGLLGQTGSSPESVKKVILNLERMEEDDISPDRFINVFHCLMEMNAHSVHLQIQKYLKSNNRSKQKLSGIQVSALAYNMMISEEVVDVLDLHAYETLWPGMYRLLPAVRNCRDARLADIDLSERHCEVVASALSSNPSHLRALDQSNNKLKDSGVKLLSAGLRSPHCRLETLRLSHCLVSEEGCASLASALSSNPSHLRELDLSFNHPGDSGVKLLSAGLEDPHWRLETLSVDHGGEHWINPKIITQYACRLTLGPNTSHSKLSLSEDNRKVESKKLPDDSEEDKQHRQVLCRETLTGRCYWEVEWSGIVDVAVTYRGASRRDEGHGFGIDDKSWSLTCYRDTYRTLHNDKITIIAAPSSESDRVGVYLDWSAGTLSFYRVSSDTLTHIYTFCSTFTEPLYPGFGLNVYYDSSVSLCVPHSCDYNADRGTSRKDEGGDWGETSSRREDKKNKKEKEG